MGKWRGKGGWPCVQTGPVMTSVCRYILWLRYLSLWLLCCTTCVCVCLWQSCDTFRTTCCLLCVFVTVLRQFEDYMLSIVCVCVTVLRQFEDYMLSIVCVCVTVLRQFDHMLSIVCVCDSPATLSGLHEARGWSLRSGTFRSISSDICWQRWSCSGRVVAWWQHSYSQPRNSNCRRSYKGVLCHCELWVQIHGQMVPLHDV